MSGEVQRHPEHEISCALSVWRSEWCIVFPSTFTGAAVLRLQELNSVIYIDSDTIWLEDPYTLWSRFWVMPSEATIGIAAENIDPGGALRAVHVPIFTSNPCTLALAVCCDVNESRRCVRAGTTCDWYPKSFPGELPLGLSVVGYGPSVTCAYVSRASDLHTWRFPSPHWAGSCGIWMCLRHLHSPVHLTAAQSCLCTAQRLSCHTQASGASTRASRCFGWTACATRAGRSPSTTS